MTADLDRLSHRAGRVQHISEPMAQALESALGRTSLAVPHAQERARVLQAEVKCAEAKLERLRSSLAERRQKLNRLLAESAMSGSARGRTDEK